MSLAAMLYVKRLRKSPSGKAITAPEKCVLQILADDHREDIGFAFPSMKTIAETAGLSIRQCRRLIAGLEKSGVIKRHGATREADGGQTSNEYVFVEIDPKPAHNAEDAAQKRSKVLRTPRTRMTGGSVGAANKGKKKGGTPRTSMTGTPGHTRPTPPDMDDLAPRTQVTESPGHGCPTIEPSIEPTRDLSKEHAREPITSPTPPREEGCEETTSDKRARTLEMLRSILPEETRDSLKRGSDVSVPDTPTAKARIFLDELHDEFARQFGIKPSLVQMRTGWEDPFEAWKRCFEHVRVASVESAEGRDSDYLVVLETPRPRDLQDGLTRYKVKVSNAMKKAFGREVQLVPRMEAA